MYNTELFGRKTYFKPRMKYLICVKIWNMHGLIYKIAVMRKFKNILSDLVVKNMLFKHNNII